MNLNEAKLQQRSKELDAREEYLDIKLKALEEAPITLSVYESRVKAYERKLTGLIDLIKESENEVEAISHRDPLTLKLARYISSRQDNFYQNQLLFLGCGAIGSKLIFHLARSGQGKMTLVDHDIMSPHNLVRHALMGNSIAQNKADAIKNILIEF